MASLLRTIFACCLRGSETDQQDEPERQHLLETPVDSTQTPPEVILSRSTVSEDQRNSALKQRLNNIVSHASHGMRSAPSQYGTYYGAASAGQTPPQLPALAPGGTQASRVGSRMSSASNRPHAQAPQARGAETPSTEATQGAANVLPSSVSNLTHRVRKTLSGPGAGSSGASSSHSPDLRLDEEPERGRRMSGMKDVLDRPGSRPSVVSPTPGSKHVSKDPYTRRDSMDIPSPNGNGKSPSYTKTNGGVGSFKIPQDDELILQYD